MSINKKVPKINKTEKISEDNVPAVLAGEDERIIIDYVKKIRSPNVYLEIGTWEGGSALVARNANPDIEVYTIDYDDTRYKLKHRTDINFIHGYSVETSKDWDKSIGVLFIDGNHDTEVEDDFKNWEKYVTSGGIIIFHDYTFHSPGVISACNTIFKNNSNYDILFVPALRGEKVRVTTSIYQVRKK